MIMTLKVVLTIDSLKNNVSETECIGNRNIIRNHLEKVSSSK